MPIFFRLFRVNDKTLRQLLFRHIVTDIKTANKKRKADQLNRAVQSFLHSIILDEHVRTAKRAVSLLAELYRRNVWSDANTVNILAAAVFHKNPSVMVAALKFFAGQARQAPRTDRSVELRCWGCASCVHARAGGRRGTRPCCRVGTVWANANEYTCDL